MFDLNSADDQVLQLSREIARHPRVGQLAASDLSKFGLNVIDLSQAQDPSSIHHSKFTDAPEVIQLIGDRILAGGTITAVDESHQDGS